MLKHTLAPLGLAIALTGCSVVSEAELQAAKDRFDADGDGRYASDMQELPGIYGDDCDDNNAAVYPGAQELAYNGLDDDCDPETPDDDLDADGILQADDCDDNNPAVNPGAPELCNGIDDNCNGDVDGDATDKITLYADADGDGYGYASEAITGCDVEGYVANPSDCDDTDAAMNPDASEVPYDGHDNDCDDATRDDDLDDDGYLVAVDCDDEDSSTYPGADLACDGVTDADCDGDVDNDDDADGFSADTCGGDDCDDGNENVTPDTIEVCNGVDDNCSDGENDATDKPTLYRDADGDTFGDPNTTVVVCEASGFVADDTDCIDTNASINPGAPEVCNDIDDNCDGDVDGDATDKASLYADADADGFGAGQLVQACEGPGYAANNTDCDDTEPGAHPGAIEIPDDGIDQTCDGADTCHDLDCDDLPDIVAGDFFRTGSNLRSYTGKVLWNSLNHWLASGPTRAWDAPSAYASADFNKDGYMDVVVGALANDTSLPENTSATLIWGGGSAPLQTTTLPAPAVMDVCVGDVDKDGWDDLLLVSSADGTGVGANAISKLYWGSEAGFSTTSRVIFDVPYASSCALADLDGDGDLDIAIGTSRLSDTDVRGSIFAWRNNQELLNRTILTASRWYNPSNYALTVADLNSDGRDDLVAWSRSGGTGTSSNPAFARTQIFYGLDTPALIGHNTGEYKDLSSQGQLYGAVADLNNDDILDIVVPSAGDGSNPASSIYWGPTYNDFTFLLVNGADGAVVADIDGDTHQDILFTTSPADPTQGSDAVIFWGTGAQDGFIETTSLPATRPAFGATVVDLDHDGYLDVVLPGQGGTTATAGQMAESFTYVYWGAEPGTSAPRGIDPTDFTATPSRARDLLVVGR